MPNRFLLQHKTRYSYETAVFLSPHLVRLRPAAHSRTPIAAYTLLVTPANNQIHWQQDPFGNFIARIDFAGDVKELTLEVKLIADLTAINPFDFFIDEYAQFFPFEYEPQLKKYLTPYLEIIDNGAMLTGLLRKADLSQQRIVDFLVSFNQLVNQNISYTTRLQPGVQTSEESLEKALGSCRDSAWLLIQLLRNIGLAARFVSGYLVQLSNTASGDENKEEDTAALHAWAEVFIPGAGWIGLDPTGGLLAAEGHIPLACSPDPDFAAPVTGTSGITNTVFTYSTSVSRF